MTAGARRVRRFSAAASAAQIAIWRTTSRACVGGCGAVGAGGVVERGGMLCELFDDVGVRGVAGVRESGGDVSVPVRHA